MAKDLAKAYVQIVPSAKGIASGIADVLEPQADASGKKAGLAIASAMKSTIIAAGIGKVISASLSEGAELQQNLGGTEAVFGNFAKNIQETAQEAYRNMGLSASEYMATANKMGSLFQGSGLEQQRSVELASEAMQRAADVASVMGISGEMAMESIAGAAKGNFTMMDNLGVAMNATTLQAYALEKGVNFSWNTASNAEKAELAMKMFMERTSQYAGNFSREADETFSGSLGAMKAAAKDLLGNLSLGNDIKPSLNALSKSIVIFVGKNLIPAVFNILKALPSGVITLVQELGTSIKELLTSSVGDLSVDMLGGGVSVITNFINGILSNIPSVISSAGTILTSFADQIMLALPRILEQGKNLVVNLMQGLISNLPSIITSVGTLIIQLLTAVASHLPEILQKGVEIVLELAAGLIKAIPDLLLKIPQIISSLKDEFMSFDWVQLGKDILVGIANGIKSAIGSVVNAAKEAAEQVYDAVKGFFGIHSPSRKMAYIGRMNDEGLAKGTLDNINVVRRASKKVMEEVAKPFDTGLALKTAAQYTMLNSTQNAAEASFGFNQEINIYAPEALSPSEVARQTRNATREMALAINLGGAL